LKTRGFEEFFFSEDAEHACSGLSGAGVALVFQLPEKRLVPIQAFIIGCTWPAVVGNYLSGRQSGEQPSQTEEESLTKKRDEVAELKQTKEKFEEIAVPDDARRKAEELEKAIEKRLKENPPET
jgi:hypothetical protein